MNRWRADSLVLLLLAVSGGCASLTLAPLPEPLRPPQGPPPPPAGTLPTEAAEELRISSTLGVTLQRTVVEGMADDLGAELQGEPVRVTFNEIPLPSFINEVFGEILGLSFVLAPGLARQEDVVTLKLTEPVSRAQLFSTARGVLAGYGVDVRDDGGVLSFFVNEEVAGRDVPLIISGRALPEVPTSHRTVFQLVPLTVANPAYVRNWLRNVFDEQQLTVLTDVDRNVVVLQGDRETVSQALSLVDLYDQPMLHARHGIILEPVFLGAGELAGMLQSVLRTEGYNVSLDQGGGAIILLVLEEIDKLIAYAVDRSLLKRVEHYVRMFDEEHRQSIENALFTYEVRNTQAEQLAETLNQILPGGSADRVGTTGAAGTDERGTAGRSGSGGPLVVDKNNNLLLYRGSGEDWAEILEVVAKLDKPVPSVLIEVVLAEITLGEEEGSGVEFMLKSTADGQGIVGGTLGALGLGAKGGTWRLDSAGQTRAVLNFFVENSKVVIRSSPRLLVKSGATGSIRVGNEIPTISQIAESGTQVGGSTNILQQVTYRNTGVSLEITPIVQANGLVDLEIIQGLSEARPAAATSLDGTPTILTRDLTTSLTLRDGGSLVMGGLIANSQSQGAGGLPWLSKLPVAGRLFRSETYLGDRTELVVMVIPYVVADYRDGQDLTERIKDELELHRDIRAN